MFRRKSESTESDRRERAIGEFIHGLTMLTLAMGRDEAAKLAACAALAVAEDDALAGFLDVARSAGGRRTDRPGTLVTL